MAIFPMAKGALCMENYKKNAFTDTIHSLAARMNNLHVHF